MNARILATVGLWLTLQSAAQAADDFGVVVMAHGGGPNWNAGVLETLAPLRADYPLEVAFGMADAASLQTAVAALEDRGVSRIAVVKLFISGESWHERTQQILGLSSGAPPRPAESSAADDHGSHGATHAGAGHTETAHAAEETAAATSHSMAFWQLESAAEFALSREGLAEAAETGEVLSDRIRALSVDPANEDILVLAHGPETDEENARWLQHMADHARAVTNSNDFHAIKVATLREDWPDKREEAVQEIRSFVLAANTAGRRVLVVPFRVHGFGPYAEVLEGLDYVADEQGLIPHPAIGRWIRRQADILQGALD